MGAHARNFERNRRIIARLRAGIPLRQIGREFGLTGEMIRLIGNAAGVCSRYRTRHAERDRWIVECLRAGADAWEISREFGLTVNMVWVIARAAGMSRTDERAERDRRIVERLSSAGGSLAALGQEFGVSRETIRRVGLAAGVGRSSGIPITYQGRRFSSRRALAKHLAPLLGRAATSLEGALCRHDGDFERVLASMRHLSHCRALA